MNGKRYIGADLERWRLENGFEIGDAIRIFGLQRHSWDKIVKQERNEPIDDLAVVHLLHLYNKYPELAPQNPNLDVVNIYKELGYKFDWNDMEEFAAILGRGYANITRVLYHGGKLGRQPSQLLAAYMRIEGDMEQKRKVMKEITEEIQAGKTSKKL